MGLTVGTDVAPVTEVLTEVVTDDDLLVPEQPGVTIVRMAKTTTPRR